MEVNKNRINYIQHTNTTKNEKTIPSESKIESKDISNCPNPYEYLGRSQIRFRGKVEPVENKFPEIKKEDLKPIVLNKSPILSKDEATKFLKMLYYTDDELAQINLDNPKTLEKISGTSAYFNIDEFKEQRAKNIEEFKNNSSEERMKFVNKEIPDNIIYWNKKNINKLQKYIDFNFDDAYDIFEALNCDNKNNVLEKLPLAFLSQGKMENYDFKRFCESNNLDKITYERADILRRINNLLPEKDVLPYPQCSKLGEDSDLTTENVDKYFKLLQKFKENDFVDITSLTPAYDSKNLKELTDSMDKIDKSLEKYPIDLTLAETDSKLTRTSLEALTQNGSIENQQYINSLSKDAKSFGIYQLQNSEPSFDKTKLAHICNTICDKDYGYVNREKLFEFLNKQKENGYKNLDGIIKLIERYKGTDSLNTSYVDEKLTVGQDDYDSAITSLDLRDEINKYNLRLPNYKFEEVLHNPESDLKNLNKMLSYIKDNDVHLGSYSEKFLSDPKGYNKLVLQKNIGQYLSYDRKKELDSLAESLNTDEEVDYAVELINQKRYPMGQDDRYRFNWNFADIKEIMQSYQNDKELTKTIVEMKDKHGRWRMTDKEDILDVVEACKKDKDLTMELLNMKTETKDDEYRILNGSGINYLVDAALTDKDYTLELLNLPDKFSRYGYYRFGAKTIANAVKAGQINKEFTNYLIDMTTEDYYGHEHYVINYNNSEDLIFFAQKANEDKDFVEFLFNSKEKDYNETKYPRFKIDTIKAVLENPPENKEFLLDLINKTSNEYGRERNKYGNYDIFQLANAVKINRDLTEQLVNATFEVTEYDDKKTYFRFRNANEIYNIVEKSVIDPEFTQELLNETQTHENEDIYPRFEAGEICRLLELSKTEDKNEIKNLLKETTVNYNDRTVHRFKCYDIESIFNSYKTDKELTNYLLSKTYISNGKKHYKYGAADIQSIIQATQIDRDYVLSIVNDKNVKRSGDDIIYLTQASQIDKDTTTALHKMMVIERGRKFPRFDGYDIKSMISAGKDDPEFVLELAQKTINKNGVNFFRFNNNDIVDLIEAGQKDKDFTRFLIDKTKTDTDGNTIPTYDANEIKNIIDNITFEQYNTLREKIGDNFENYTYRDIVTIAEFPEFLGVNGINEIPIAKKKLFLKKLVACNADLFNTSEFMKKDFPLIPKNADEYCSVLPSVVRALGIETNECSDDKIEKFNKQINNLTKSLHNLSDEEFDNLEIKQDYSNTEFIKDVMQKINSANLSDIETKKIFDYYGFELHKNPNNPTGYSIVGYPVNLNSGKKLAEINDAKTKKVVEDLRKNVIKFSENNHIKSNNKDIQNLLNDIAEVLPEMHNLIGKKNDNLHNTDIFKQSLKVLQKIGQNKEYTNLNESDKKLMQLAALMHNIAKAEGCDDKMNPKESSFDTYFIAKKFKLSKDEEIKLYTLINNHDWLNSVEFNSHQDYIEKQLQSIAFDLQQNNNFDISKIFADASIDSINPDEVELKQNLKTQLEKLSPKIKEYVNELKKSQPLLPVTQMPKTSEIEKHITYVEPDGSTNIKGVYKDKDGLLIVKFNEVENWQDLGLPAGATTKGIMAKAIENARDGKKETETETGNIKFFVHGLDYSNQLAKFDAFSLADSDALLSVSYAERPETKYRFFRPQGVMLDVASNYVYGGGNTDSGSGYSKNIDRFKSDYVFGGYRESDRLYVSNLIKEETGMSDEEYVKFIEQNKDKAMHEIEPKELQTKIVQKLATINSNIRNGNRAYNEMYVSNPRSIMGVFAYNMNNGEELGDPLEFLKENNERTEFLKKYALEYDVPFYLFGD